MNTKNRLLKSVSLAALIALSTSEADADSFPDGYTLIIEGGLLWGQTFSFTSNVAGPSQTSIDQGSGFNGTVGLGRKIDDMWDVTLLASLGEVNNIDEDATYLFGNTNFGVGSSGSSSLDADIDFQAIDLEFGYKASNTETVKARAFGGLRALHFDDKTKLTLRDRGTGVPGSVYQFASVATETLNTEFWGLGPRAGGELAVRPYESIVGLSGKIAGAALFGVSDSDVSASQVSSVLGSIPVLPEWNPGNDKSEFRVIMHAEASVGVDFHILPGTVVTFGYKVEKFWDVREPNSLVEDDQVFHSANAKLVKTF